LITALRTRIKLRIQLGFTAAEVEKQEKGALRSLGVLPAAADDRPSRTGRVVKDRFEVFAHELRQDIRPM
jgi:hypothetical protein